MKPLTIFSVVWIGPSLKILGEGADWCGSQSEIVCTDFPSLKVTPFAGSCFDNHKLFVPGKIGITLKFILILDDFLVENSG